MIYDKFIEVKSFSDREQFFWSKNEVQVAKILLDQYYLYLVDRRHEKDDNFCPIIIQNPYNSIYEDSKWHKETESWV